MQRESKRNCPFCRAKGITKGKVCDICKGSKKIVIRYNTNESREKDIEVFETVCEAIREDIKLK